MSLTLFFFFFGIETLVFWILNLDTSTNFRMFLPSHIVLDYPMEAAYISALLYIVSIPHYISSKRRLDGRSTLGTM